jgi:hypothetical protein
MPKLSGRYPVQTSSGFGRVIPRENLAVLDVPWHKCILMRASCKILIRIQSIHGMRYSVLGRLETPPQGRSSGSKTLLRSMNILRPIPSTHPPALNSRRIGMAMPLSVVDRPFLPH